MKFCLHQWKTACYKPRDPVNQPSSTKTVSCELEEGHAGDHRSREGAYASNPNLSKVRQ